ncbi:MAG: hypothetical protein KGN34_09895 [Sphingomonadales bacterium]|nr:hypothetical protein [Sphingomonadales bacterium]
MSFPPPVPGLWRRIRIVPAAEHVTAGLEDDIHRFHVRLRHADGLVTAVEADAVRHPWTGCLGAPGKLGQDFTGRPLADVARTVPGDHCTHLRDLAVLAAAHAADSAETHLDMHVADRDAAGRTTAVLSENGTPMLEWPLAGTMIIAGPHAGRDLRHLSRWQSDLTPRETELAHALRRAVFVSGARAFDPPPGQTGAELADNRVGACYNFSAPQRHTTTRREGWKGDFHANGGTPLEGFDPEAPLPPV